jgi:hypothetical protein
VQLKQTVSPPIYLLGIALQVPLEARKIEALPKPSNVHLQLGLKSTGTRVCHIIRQCLPFVRLRKLQSWLPHTKCGDSLFCSRQAAGKTEVNPFVRLIRSTAAIECKEYKQNVKNFGAIALFATQVFAQDSTHTISCPPAHQAYGQPLWLASLINILPISLWSSLWLRTVFLEVCRPFVCVVAPNRKSWQTSTSPNVIFEPRRWRALSGCFV